MDYIDQLKQFSVRAKNLVPVIQTEEATKNALILPFFQMLGYDVFNPAEFVPEFVADVGTKKGEKVDYAIMVDGAPAILIEAKWCGEDLAQHDSQLFRYFATSDAKLAILTNGIIYRFYTDLDAPNKMDLTPFMEFNLFDIKENLIPELKRFQKASLDVEDIFSAASDLKYTTAVKKLLAQQASDPDEAFIAYVTKEVYDGRRTAQVTDKFKEIIKKSFSQYISDLMNDRFKTMMATVDQKPEKPEDEKPADDPIEEKPVERAVTTTVEELEGYAIIKAIVSEVISPERVTYKDTLSYFSILVDGNVRRAICRLFIEGKKKSIAYWSDSESDFVRYPIKGCNDLFDHRHGIIESAKHALA